MKTLRLLSMVMLAMLLSMSVIGAGAQDSSHLFSDAPFASDAAPDGKVGVMRSRAVNINMDLLNASADTANDPAAVPNTLTLNLFDDTTVTATLSSIEARPSGEPGYVWVGALAGEAFSDVVLVVSADGVQGAVNVPGIGYEITEVNGVGRVIEIDKDAIFARLVNDGIPPPTNLPPAPMPDIDPNAVPDDDGSIIDVMVLYTAAARTKAGGEVAVKKKIDEAITVTNAGYAASGVNHRVRLVYVYETGYVEGATESQGSMLDKLANPSDGNMDEAHTLRNTYAADLVSLISTSTQNQSCGIAYQPNSEFSFTQTQGNAGFSVNELNCTGGTDVTVAHELGHNMGAAHNVEDAGGEPIYNYAYGHRDPGNFRTVMSYSCTADSLAACPAVNRWSNQTLTYNGRPQGTATADNYVTLNNTANWVANYRQSNTAQLPDTPFITPQGTVDAADNIQIQWVVPPGVESFQLDVYDPYQVKKIGQQVLASSCPVSDVADAAADVRVCSVTLNAGSVVGEYNAYIQSQATGRTGVWRRNPFTLKLGKAPLTSPNPNAVLAADVPITFNEVPGAIYYVVDIYRADGSYVRIDPIPTKDNNCNAGVCTVQVPTNNVEGAYSAWIVAGVGPFFGDWQQSTFNVGLGAVRLTSPTGTLVPAAKATLQFPKMDAAGYVVLDLYRPSGGQPQRYTVQTSSCTGDTCSVEVDTNFELGTFNVWTIPGVGADKFGPWTNSTFAAALSNVQWFGRQNGSTAPVNDIEVGFSLPDGAGYVVVDLYRPGATFNVTTDRKVVERGTGTCNWVFGTNTPGCIVGFDDLGQRGTYNVWMVPGVGSSFGGWSNGSFNFAADTLAAEEVDVLGNAAEALPSLDTSAVEAAVEGPGN